MHFKNKKKCMFFSIFTSDLVCSQNQFLDLRTGEDLRTREDGEDVHNIKHLLLDVYVIRSRGREIWQRHP